MAALRFTLREAPPQRVDLSALVPARLAGLDRAAIERLPIQTTRAPLAVGDLFRVRGDDPRSIVIEGGSARFDRVAEAMEEGTLLVEGAAGACAGRGMRGGRLEVRGDVGPFAGSAARGGEIEIAGDTGDCLGGPLAGELAGMAGGVLLVRGRVGARAADRLRRGLIVVEGGAGEAPGSRMIAGTLIVCGSCGPMPGILMRRGTLVLGEAADPMPSFAASGRPDPVFVRLLARAVAAASRPAARLLGRPLARFTGDNATIGRGEILLPAAAL
jgi:formylmethanofuran dehydrogenase subunit C